MKKVTIYSRDTCAPCKTVKYLLTKKGIEYTEKNIDDPQHQNEYAKFGMAIVPILVIGETIITGANFGAINTALST